MRVLFLCARNRRRSPTAEALFAGRPGLEVASAGLAPDAEEVVTPETLAWAASSWKAPTAPSSAARSSRT